MKISRTAIVLWGAGLGLSVVLAEHGATCTPTKAQLILRQKIAELNQSRSSRTKAELLADAERLHKEGKLSDKEFEELKKQIDKQYAASGGSLSPEAQAKAQKALEEKIAELNAGQKIAAPPSPSGNQAKAEEALQRKLDELRAGAPAQPKPTQPQTGTVAQEALRQKLAELRTPEKTNLIPASAGATLTPELEAKAREVMRMKIAEARKNEPVQPEANTEAQAKALAVLHQSEAELKAGVTPETPEPTRVLRLKIAESKGTITQAEAAQAIAAPATATPAPAATPTAAKPAATPAVAAPAVATSNVAAPAAAAVGASPVTFQTSNKTGLARLNELTQLYKADRITPYEYHHERAKIVATL